MSWYYIPNAIVSLLFVVFLTSAVLRMLAALQAGELLLEKRALRTVRLDCGIKFALSAVLSVETLLASASIEGGVFLPIPSGFRYIAALPAVVFLLLRCRAFRLPSRLGFSGAGCLIPLLLLPPVGRLPGPLPLLLVSFSAIWLLIDAARHMGTFREYARGEITRDAVTHVLRLLDHGVCIADRRGRILEANPAFYRLCETLGLQPPARISEFEEAADRLCEAGQLTVGTPDNGRSLRTADGVYFYRQSSFRSDRKSYVELSLSDVTDITRAASALQLENASLEQENRRLERVIADIGLEAAAKERDALSRAAHDLWSQRLAIAGLTTDILLEEPRRGLTGDGYSELRRLLEAPGEPDAAPAAFSVDALLENLSAMYMRLGVEIRSGGKVDFAPQEREALCAVLRESLANAVRHAYARRIDVQFTMNATERGVVIRNDCLDSNRPVREGRGLRDMTARVRSAGGTITYVKGDTFELRAVFSGEPAGAKEAVF